jgi:hypothetical protein
MDFSLASFPHIAYMYSKPAQAQSVKAMNPPCVLENENIVAVPSATMVTDPYSDDHTSKEDTGLLIARQLLETKEVETIVPGVMTITKTLPEDEDMLLGMDVTDQNTGASIVPIIGDVLDTRKLATTPVYDYCFVSCRSPQH